MRARALLPLLAAVGLAVGCTAIRDTPETAVGPSATPPWAVPASEIESRHLFRLAYEGPEGSGSLKTALFLDSHRDFTVRVFDRFGRPVWAARTRDGETLRVDHRREIFCRTAGPVIWAGIEDLGPLPPRALPALLLHRVPLAPGEDPSATVRWDGRRFRFRDRGGRRWSGRVDAEGVAAWTLREDRRPVWWWSRGADGEAVLSQRGRGRQLRWRRLATEPLDAPSPELEIPPGYRECGLS